MRGLVGLGWGAGMVVSTAACFSSSSGPTRETDFDAQPFDASLLETEAPVDTGSPEAALDSGCVPPQNTGCSFSVMGAATGSGTCEPGVVFVGAAGTAQISVGAQSGCTPVFFFTAVFTTPNVAPGTYTAASPTVEDAQSGWCPNDTVCWREWQRPAPAEGSFTLTITSADATPTDGGLGSVHGSVSATFPILADGQTDAGTVIAQATF